MGSRDSRTGGYGRRSPSAWRGPGFSAVTFNLSGSGVDDAGEFVFPERFGHNTFSAELQDLRRVVDALTAGELGVAPPTGSGCWGIRGAEASRCCSRPRDPNGCRRSSRGPPSPRVERWPEPQRAAWRAAGVTVGEERADRPGPPAVHRRPRRHRAKRRRPRHRGGRGADRGALAHRARKPRTSRWRCWKASGWPRPRRRHGPGSCPIDGAGHTFGAAHPWRGATPELEQVADATLAFFAAELR